MDMKSLFGQERIDHIAQQQKKAKVMLATISHKLAMQLSYYEVYDLMIRAIEDQALCDIDEIRRRSKDVTENCATISRIVPAKERPHA
jgi:hypothetical protein